MRKIFVVLSLLLLAACNKDVVPEVKDPNNPLDENGKPISRTNFIQKYCPGQDSNKNCIAVKLAENLAAGRGKMPAGY